MAEQRLQKLETINSEDVWQTAYQQALNTKDETFYKSLSESLIGALGIAFVVALFAGPKDVYGGLAWIWIDAVEMLCYTFAVSSPVLLFVGEFKRLIQKSESRKVFANPLNKFKWCLTRAMKVFNQRASAWNYWLEGHQIGCIEDDGDMRRIYSLLLRSHQMLVLAHRRYQWYEKGTNLQKQLPEPKLGIFLAELEDRSELPAKALLENESALLEMEDELAGFLPART